MEFRAVVLGTDIEPKNGEYLSNNNGTTAMNFKRAKALFSALTVALAFILTGGCAHNPVSSTTMSLTNPQAVPGVSISRPKPADIVEFKADTTSAKGHFKDFKVERNYIEEILSKWYQVPREHWLHGYSHVALGDRTGTIRLKNGTTVKWMVRPGGLAEFVFQDGTEMYLAKELTQWEKNAEQAADKSEKIETAYTFLLKKVQSDGVNSIATKDDKNLDLIQKTIHANNLNLKVESYINLEKGPDLCYYSKSTKETAAIIDVTERGEKSYYVSYYIGPEGGASKEILVEKRNGKWMVANDDGMWSVK